jgi:secreted trypsin-like serine protease
MAILPFAVAAAEEHAGGRVIGGTPIPNARYPFLVYVDIPKSGCTGTLVDAEWVLTAAHCVYGDSGVRPPNAFHVVIGRADLSQREVGSRVSVVRVEPHPRYNRRTLGSDVALLRLARPVGDAGVIPLVGPGDHGFERHGRPAIVAGWGAVRQAPNVYPERAREARVEVVGTRACRRAWGGGITSEMLCAGNPRRVTCFGDSGGPLFVATGRGFVQIGVTSFGTLRCGDLPAGFARLSNPEIAAFIRDTIGET